MSNATATHAQVFRASHTTAANPVATLRTLVELARASRVILARAMTEVGELPVTIAAEVGPLLSGQLARAECAERSLMAVAETYAALLEDDPVPAIARALASVDPSDPRD